MSSLRMQVTSLDNDPTESKTRPAASERVPLKGRIQLDVGGLRYSTSITTLTEIEPESALAKMFRPPFSIDPESDGTHFIDRNGKLFEYILEWLRDQQLPSFPSRDIAAKVAREADFYGLVKLTAALKEAVATLDAINRREVPTRSVPSTITSAEAKIAMGVLTRAMACDEKKIDALISSIVEQFTHPRDDHLPLLSFSVHDTTGHGRLTVFPPPVTPDPFHVLHLHWPIVTKPLHRDPNYKDEGWNSDLALAHRSLRLLCIERYGVYVVVDYPALPKWQTVFSLQYSTDIVSSAGAAAAGFAATLPARRTSLTQGIRE